MSNSSQNPKPRVLIVGGGFAGVRAALLLGKSRRFTVTLLSDNDNFSYHPALYHTATGGQRRQSAVPLRDMLQGADVQFVRGEAVKLDRKAKTITTKDGQTLAFDTLIMALGMVVSYFGIPGVAEHSFGIKSGDEALRFKKHLHEQLAAGHADENYVVVGGGPTGIELAGALPGYLRRIMRTHGVSGPAPKVIIVEAMPQLVPRMPASMAKAITKQLQKLDIQLYLGKAVKGQTADALQIDGEKIPTHTVVWTAGQANAPFYKANDFALNPKGKVTVDEHLRAEPDIYVLGDNADTEFSGMAQTALLDAEFVASNLVRATEGRKPETYHAKKPVYVFPAGPHWAAVLWGKAQFYGRAGWLLRALADLNGFRELLPLQRAVRQCSFELGSEETCEVCKKAN